MTPSPAPEAPGRPVSGASAAFAHPAFAPYGRWLRDGTWPDLATLNREAQACAIASARGMPIRFAPEDPGAPHRSALAYERAVAETGRVAMRRDAPHDVANALVWLAFPQMKAACNARHVAEGAGAAPNARSAARDAVTLLDESGLVLACTDATLVALLRARAWRTLFVERRADVATAMRPVVVGHGLLAKLLQPYRAATAHVLVVPVAAAALPADGTADAGIDTAVARLVGDPHFGPASLTPLPVAALPGWDCEGLGERLFDDRSVFR